MTHFTPYQAAHYERLFLRYAHKDKTVPLAELGQLLVRVMHVEILTFFSRFLARH